MTNKESTIAMYIRISSEDEDKESNSIKNQKNLLENYINSSPELSKFEVIAFVDDGYSGTNFERPAFKEMMEDIKNGTIDCVLVKDLSRFGRNYLEVGRYIEHILPSMNIRFVAINDNYDSIKNSINAEAIEIPFKNLVNDFYAKDISKKIMSAKESLMKQGKFLSSHAIYGYSKDEKDKHKLVRDTEAAIIVERIFKMYLEGIGISEIASTFNKEGILTPAKYKKKKGSTFNSPTAYEKSFWKKDAVLRLLKDERYTGKSVNGTTKVKFVGSKNHNYVAKEDYIVVSGMHEAIVSQRDFTKVMKLMGNRRTTTKTSEKQIKQKQDEHVITRVRCGGCNSILKRAGQSPRFKCRNKKVSIDNTCFDKSILVRHVESYVFEVLVKHIKNIVSINELFQSTRAKNEENRIMFEIEKEEKKLLIKKAKKLSQYEEYRKGNLDKQKYLAIKEEAEILIGMIENRILDLEKSIRSEEINAEKRVIENAKEHLDALILCKKMYDDFVEEIFIHDLDKIKIVLKNQEEYKRICKKKKK